MGIVETHLQALEHGYGEPSPLVPLDDERCYRAVLGRDRRFDGWFVTAVRTTRIYCRPSCPTPVLPKRINVDFYQTAAAAQQAGFRACKRCRPDATPGSPAWNPRADLVGRALRQIADGTVDRQGVAGLARCLSVSERHLHRVLVDQVGAGPIALARAQRAQTARLLVETTDLPLGQVAFAAGFASIRQFNDTVRQVFDSSPTVMRSTVSARLRKSLPLGLPGAITVRLAMRQPFDAGSLLAFLAGRSIPGVDEIDGATYRRSISLPHGPAVMELTPNDDHVGATYRLSDVADLATAIARSRRLLDLDADPVAIDSMLSIDPALARCVVRVPGRRSPGAVDAHELAVRAVLGQQVTVAAARTLASRLATRYGQPLATPIGGVTITFPSAAVLAAIDPSTIGIPMARARALVGMCAALADATVSLEPGADRMDAARSLEALPGIGPWTASYVCMRALSDPDAFLPTDIAVRKGAGLLGMASDVASLSARASTWAPWRSYAVHHLWAACAPPKRESL